MHVLTSGHTSDELRMYVLRTLRTMAVWSNGFSQPAHLSATLSDDSRVDDSRARITMVTQGLLMILNPPPHLHSSASRQPSACHTGVRCAALELLGQLAFNVEHRRRFLADARILIAIRRLALGHNRLAHEDSGQAQGERPPDSHERAPSPLSGHSNPHGSSHVTATAAGETDEEVKAGRRWKDVKDVKDVKAARRVLAILGDNQFLGVGMREGAAAGRGARILVVDGGGVKGIASIRILHALEQRCGRPLHSLFDLIVGTSAGGIIVSGITSGMEMTEIQRIYSFVVKGAFSAPKSEAARARATQSPPGLGAEFSSARVAARSAGMGSEGGVGAGAGHKEDEVAADGAKRGWWSKLMESSSSMTRVLFQGAKYDAAPLMEALETVFGPWCHECMIENALEHRCCQAAIVSTLVSERPVRPYIFRSYQLPPPGVSGLGEVFGGTCQHTWLEAMRASSAAPYFFDEFSCRGERYQDGAIVANNPSIMSLHEAQRLWVYVCLHVFTPCLYIPAPCAHVLSAPCAHVFVQVSECPGGCKSRLRRREQRVDASPRCYACRPVTIEYACTHTQIYSRGGESSWCCQWGRARIPCPAAIEPRRGVSWRPLASL
jgi:hypothetical protein